jgi:hypothetical protein
MKTETLPETWSVRMVPERYITLPYQVLERYGPYTTTHGYVHEAPPKGTVLEEGFVDIKESTLYEVDERSTNDYLLEITPPFVGYKEGLALEAAGLAVQETRGGYHGTAKLTKLLRKMEKSEKGK